MKKIYDLVIIGGGPGGYVAAIRASKLGLQAALVEKSKLGGTCLHAGCIPSKALLRSAEIYANTKNAEQFGVVVPECDFDFSKAQLRKEQIMEQLYKGVQHLMKKGKVDVYEGFGRIAGPRSVLVEKLGEGMLTLGAGNILVATGSRPRSLPGFEPDGKYVMTSDEALQMTDLPKSIIIVGGGVIGIEWASMFSDFGLDVTIIEYEDRILPTEDRDISREMQRLLKKKKVKIITHAKILPETLEKGDGVFVKAEHKGEEKSFAAEKILVSVGRKPNTENIGLDILDIEMDRAFIKTNEHYQTNVPNIYAIGDVIGGLQLAHVASREGAIAVEHMAGVYPAKLDPVLVPKCIYSSPEAASVGLTEDQAKEEGFFIKTSKFSFRAVGKALVFGNPDGFVKFVVEEGSGQVLGVHMVGPNVTEMISGAGLAQVFNLTAMDIAETIHPHPTLSEAIGEAALAITGMEVHA